MLSYRRELGDMPSYDVVERDWKIKVNANECSMNLPPMVEERIMARLSHVAFHRYPNEQLDDFCEMLAGHYGVQKENVLVGSGSSEIIEKIFYCFGGNGQSIVYPQPSFSMYPIYAKAAEATGVPVGLEEDYGLDVEKFVRAARESRASLAVLCNPNNPTGTGFSLSDVEYIAENLDCAFLVDEAYMEFYGQSAVPLLGKYPRMIVARTFSKAYGLAAARVGYMLADAGVREMVGKAYMPYHMNVLSLVAASTAFQMRGEFEPRIHIMVSERKRMQEALRKIPGMQVYPSVTNFLLAKHERAKELNVYMESLGIGLRSFGDAPRLENCLRISMGTREENDLWYQAMKDFVEGEG